MPRTELHSTTQQGNGYLDGQLLLAMPAMVDPRFARAVIYMCAHSADGAMGIVVNQRAPNITFPKLLEQLDIHINAPEGGITLPVDKMAVHFGGPVETGRGFVLHTSDYYVAESTLPIDESVCLTATIDILRAIASGSGPARSLLALGYAGWAPGQLESEIHANGWLTCQADVDIIFDDNLDAKYERALAKLGVHPSFLVNDAGHA
jgi:putative transcriptional regulator